MGNFGGNRLMLTICFDSEGRVKSLGFDNWDEYAVYASSTKKTPHEKMPKVDIKKLRKGLTLISHVEEYYFDYHNTKLTQEQQKLKEKFLESL